ncbi:MAG: hypothetical protein AUH88_06245 [Acidobacteria bacterium 13_1_40CM_4_61_5]|nr:MAG: hypothetical protein AUH88_06245 [Acidobacteria bacterium 13_1_40CM_4_61_5]
MTNIEMAGRWLFFVLAGSGCIFALELLILHFHDPAVSGNVVPRVAWILIYLWAAVGIVRWKPWAYLLGILVAVASIFYGIRGFSRSSHPGVDGFILVLWLLCLVWLWLPAVREKFKPVTK